MEEGGRGMEAGEEGEGRGNGERKWGGTERGEEMGREGKGKGEGRQDKKERGDQ